MSSVFDNKSGPDISSPPAAVCGGGTELCGCLIQTTETWHRQPALFQASRCVPFTTSKPSIMCHTSLFLTTTIPATLGLECQLNGINVVVELMRGRTLKLELPPHALPSMKYPTYATSARHEVKESSSPNAGSSYGRNTYRFLMVG